MALYTIKGSKNIPENGVKVGKSEAIKYQKEIVRDWKNPTDVIFLRNAKYLAAGLVITSSYLIIKDMRKMLKLGYHSFVLSYYPIFLTPIPLIRNFDKDITNNVLIMEMKCQLCWQLKYTLKQTALGVLFPFVLGNISSAYSAILKNTYAVPNLNKEPKKYLQFMYTLYRNGEKQIKILASLHLLSAFFWPYIQNVELTNITNCLKEKMKIYDELL